MADPFALLAGGLSFKSKHNQKAKQIFKQQNDKRDAEMEDIDFFQKNTRVKRRKKITSTNDNHEEKDQIIDVKQIRKRSRIYVKGTDIADPIVHFEDLKAQIHENLLSIISSSYDTPTPIQQQAIPVLLSDRDVVAIAPTGSGKTLAFLTPLIEKLGRPKAGGPFAVIVAPTRELALQIQRQAETLNLHAELRIKILTKASASRNSTTKLTKIDLLICTPMRLVYAIKAEQLDLSKTKFLIFDEADRLFENGFEHQIDEIIHASSNVDRRIGLFSATMPQRVEELAQSVLKNYVRINIGVPNSAAADVDQKLVFVGREDGKLVAFQELIQEGIEPPVLIFVQSKSRAKELFQELVYDDLRIDVIHSDLTENQRDAIIQDFRQGKVWVLICTDLMARGVDFKGVNMVINYDFPASAIDYIHRVGRTGRGGLKGRAITFFTRDDAPILRSIATVIQASGCDVPQWMLKLKKLKKHQRSRTVSRQPISSHPASQKAYLERKRQFGKSTHDVDKDHA